MAFVKLNNCNLYYERHGNGKEIVLLLHGLLWSGKMFQKQVEFLSEKYTVYTYDHRGQGGSEVTNSGYDMDSLFLDAVAFIETICKEAVHFGGLSMGGFVGMRLAARRPELLKSLILMETSALPEPFKFKYNLLNTIVKIAGVGMVKKPVMKIMFGDTFLNDSSRKEERIFWENELLNNKKSIIKAVQGVIDRNGVEDELEKIKCPTLIIVGNEDKATVPAKSEFIHAKIPHSELKYIKYGGHSACLEEPLAYNQAISEFLAKL